MIEEIDQSENYKSTDNVVISIQDLTKYYGDQIGIQDLNLEIYQGEIFGYLGRNGAGKTTTIRCILNLLIPDRGTIKINGKEISRKNSEFKDQIGYLPGELNVPLYYKVEDFLHYIASLRKRPSYRMAEIANRLELPLGKKVGQLSKGNKQKMGIVLALMSDPDILIFDEPTAGLDPIYQQDIFKILIEEKKLGKTIFFSSHNLDEVQRLCDRVGIIRDGKLVSVETVEDLASKIPRRLKAIISNLNDDMINHLKESKINVRNVNFDLGTLEIEIKNSLELADVLDDLNEWRVTDIIFPPASLEEYFLSKYEEV